MELDRFIFGVQQEDYLLPTTSDGSQQQQQIAIGQVFAKRDDAVCVRTKDGAVWISTTRAPRSRDTPEPFKLPATIDLADKLADVPASIISPLAPPDPGRTYQEICLEIINGSHGKCGILHFNFYNGAMDTRKCMRLSEAIRKCQDLKKLSVLILAGKINFFS